VAGFYKRGNELPASIKCREFLDYLNTCPKKGCAPRTYLIQLGSVSCVKIDPVRTFRRVVNGFVNILTTFPV
jgi:hypothetical protein